MFNGLAGDTPRSGDLSVPSFTGFPQPPNGVNPKGTSKHYTVTCRVPVISSSGLIDAITYPAVSTGTITGVLDGSTVWTVAITDLDGAVDGWIGANAFWLDEASNLLWVFGRDTATSPDTLHSGSINLDTGAVSNKQSAQVTNDASLQTSPEQTAINQVSGNEFVFYTENYTLVYDAGAGTITSETAEVNGTTSSIGSYATTDGNYIISFNNPSLSVTAGLSYVEITNRARGETCVIGIPPGIGPAASCIPRPAGSNVFMLSEGGIALMPSVFKRTDFDVWVKALARYAGILS